MDKGWMTRVRGEKKKHGNEDGNTRTRDESRRKVEKERKKNRSLQNHLSFLFPILPFFAFPY